MAFDDLNGGSKSYTSKYSTTGSGSAAIVAAAAKAALAKSTTKKTTKKTTTPKKSVVYTAPSSSKKTTSSSGSSGGSSSGGSSSGGYSSGGSSSGGSSSGGSSSGVKESADKGQVKALNKLLDTGFKAALKKQLTGIDNATDAQDANLITGYKDRMSSLQMNLLDNDRSEADASFANLVNRAREQAEVVDQAHSQGAGESDILRAQLMAVRNWDINQDNINRSFFDTQRSVNTAITDFNADTRDARINLNVQAEGDRNTAYANYYNQKADAYTQLGNLHANPYSDSFDADKGKKAYDGMATAASSSYTIKAPPASLSTWSGKTNAKEEYLNNRLIGTATTLPKNKTPEGSTLKDW